MDSHFHATPSTSEDSLEEALQHDAERAAIPRMLIYLSYAEKDLLLLDHECALLLRQIVERLSARTATIN